jgi:putative hydrolase of the HAD superfamily
MHATLTTPWSSPFSTVLVDLDGTLVDPAGWGETLRALDDLAENGAGSVAPSAAIEAALAAAWDEEPVADAFRTLGFVMADALWSDFCGEHPALAEIQAWAPGFRERFWSRVISSAGLVAAITPQDLAASYINHRRAGIRACAGAAAALDQLAMRFRLVLVSNGTGDLQHLKLVRAGLASRFELILISGEVGEAKPGALIFERALELAEADADTAVMVGDDWGNDVLGAVAAGIRAVHLSGAGRAGSCSRPDSTAGMVRTVERFADVPALLSTAG